MKVTNLMVGDWVQHNGNPKMISVIWPFSVSLYDPTKTLGSIYADKFSVEEIQPIELTPDILEKNGFTKEYGAAWNIYRFSASWFALYKKEFGFMLSVGSYEISIKYVHELQHALKLCGIDKEITL
jgi:hypothetical protein